MKLIKQLLASFALLMISTSVLAIKTTVTFIHTDHLGSPVLATKEDGSVKWREDYQPFGSQLLNQDTSNNIGFTGHKDDNSLGLTYMQARWYNPEIGRFYALDPILFRDVHSFNRYVYGNNNPYKYVDPDGKEAFTAFRITLAFATADAATPDPSDAAAPVKAAGYAGALIGTAIGGTLVYGYDLVFAESTEENTNPYDGPVDVPVIAVDSDGNAIPVGEGEEIKSSPDGDYQQVRGRDGKPTGVRLDRGGHKGQSDPKAREPHAHQPGVTDETGNPHLPLNPPNNN